MTDHTYKYFLVGNTIPVRVTFNDHGLKLGAEVPDPEQQDLKIDFDALHRVEQSPEVDEIDQARFEELCSGIYSKKNFELNHGG